MQSIFHSIDHERLLDIILNQGIDYVDIHFMEKNTDIYFARDYNILSTKHSTDIGTGFRMIHKGKMHYYSTNTYDDIGSKLQKLAKNIVQFSTSNNVTSLYPTAQHKSSVKLPMKDYVLADYKNSEDDFLDTIRMILLQYLTPQLSFSLKFEYQKLEKQYISSDNIQVEQFYNLGILILSISSKQNTRTQAFGGIDHKTLEVAYIESEIKKMIKEVIDLDSAKLVKKGKYDVALSNDMAWTLIHETVGHGVEADSILQGKSFLDGLLGRKIAHSSINIIDDPHIRTSGWVEFDDEGTKSPGSIIVEEGFLKDYLHSRITASLLGGIPTGNARSESYLDPPSPRQTNTFIEPQDYSHEELLETVKNGIFIGASNEANVSMYTGEFTISPQIMYSIKNGEIDKPLNYGLLQGFALDTLNHISGVGKELKSYPAICLKNNSKVPMGMISPEIVVRKMQVI